MNFYNTYSTLIFATILVVVMGCRSFVEVEPPKSQLLGEQVFEDAGTALAALTGLYTHLRSDGRILNGVSMSMTGYTGYAADELISHSVNVQTGGPNFYRNTVFPDSDDVLSLWNATFTQVYYANAIIEGVARSSGISQAAKEQFTGEALFIRAILHFYLLNLYGDIPYITTTDYRVNRSVARLPERDVYDAIMTDLTAAASLVGAVYPSAERVRPNKSAVHAFQARVHLYRGEWQQAVAMANEVIGQEEVYQWVDELDKVFLKESTGTIWAFKPQREGSNTVEGGTFILTAPPMVVSMSELLYAAFEPGDQRREKWVGSYSQGSTTWHFPYKYKVRADTKTTENLEYSVILRIDEQYLIRAEALAHLGDIIGAQADLNRIRRRAGLEDTAAATAEALLDAILHERQVELFTEFGHRWFDLKRMGKADEVLGAVKPNWDATDILLPLPEKELLSNPNLLPQNPGYGS